MGLFDRVWGLQWVRGPHARVDPGRHHVHAWAFFNCSNLRTVALPASLTSPLGSKDPNFRFGMEIALAWWLSTPKPTLAIRATTTS